MITKSLDELNEKCIEIMGAFVVVCTEKRGNEYCGVICTVDAVCINCKETVDRFATPEYALKDVLKLASGSLTSYPCALSYNATSIRCDN